MSLHISEVCTISAIFSCGGTGSSSFVNVTSADEVECFRGVPGDLRSRTDVLYDLLILLSKVKC